MGFNQKRPSGFIRSLGGVSWEEGCAGRRGGRCWEEGCAGRKGGRCRADVIAEPVNTVKTCSVFCSGLRGALRNPCVFFKGEKWPRSRSIGLFASNVTPQTTRVWRQRVGKALASRRHPDKTGFVDRRKQTTGSGHVYTDLWDSYQVMDTVNVIREACMCRSIALCTCHTYIIYVAIVTATDNVK